MKIRNLELPDLFTRGEDEPSPRSPQVEDQEEKPLFPSEEMDSEDSHGGEEATDSIADSPSVSDTGEESRDSESGGEDGDAASDEATDPSGGEKSGSGDGEFEGEEGKELGEEGGDERGDERGEEEGGEGREPEENSDELEELLNLECEDGEGGGEVNDVEEGDGEYNTDPAISHDSAIAHDYVSIPRLKQIFYRVIDALADSRAGVEDGHEILNMKRCIKRVMDKRSMERCKVNIVKQDIIIVLDDSGSMIWWTNLLMGLAELCIKRNDIQVFWAPNGRINDPYWERANNRVVERPFPNTVKDKSIIYVGDFDGGDTPYILAKAGANVVWYCPEKRYENTIDHNWCHHDLKDYPSSLQFFFTNSLVELCDALKKTKKKW